MRRGPDHAWPLYREIGALRTVAAFASWLFKIIERECYRLFHARDRLQAMDQSLDNVLRQEPLPLELRKDLVAAIALLPDPYRKILILRDIDELTAPEAAEQLGISIDAVKSRLHRAREMVRERLLAGGYLASTTQQKDYAGVLQPICFHSLAARYWRRRDDCLGHPVRQRACLAGAAAFDWCRRIDAGMPDVLADGAVRDHFGPP